MRQRNAGVCRTSKRRGDSWYHLEFNAFSNQRLNFFSASTKREWVATLKPNDTPSSASIVKQQLVNFLLANTRKPTFLTDVDLRRVLSDVCEYLGETRLS